MVLSRINNKITFNEDKFIEAEDKGFNASLYEIEINGVVVEIALGDVKYRYIDQGILYVPIYLIVGGKTKKVGTQMGVYEFFSDNLMDLMDEDGDLDIEKLDDPLLYEFVTVEFLKKEKGNKEEGKEEDESEEEIEVSDGDEEALEEKEEKKEEKKDKKEEDSEPEGTMFTDDEEVERELTGNKQEGLEGDTFEIDDNKDGEDKESKITDELEKKKFKASGDSLWINKFMKRDEYDIIDSLYENVPGPAGDCLFAVIQDSFKSIGKEISISKMRAKLSSKMSMKTYTEYKEFYDLFNESVKKDEAQLKTLKVQHDGLRVQASQVKTTNRGKYKELVQMAKGVEKNFRRVKKEKDVSEEYLEEFDFMKGITSLEEMKAKVKTCDFWADTWALSILETIYNIKFIIMSSEKFEAKDYDNVLLCGQINDDKELKDGKFKPKYYIIIDHTGPHYKLITWKNKKILTFNEIPYGIRELIVNKCMEKNAGKFSLIPKFKKFKGELEKIAYHPDLYTENTVFQFYSKSAPKYPGTGAGEKLRSEDKDKYLELSRIPDWRKKLSNFYKSEFVLDNHKWLSVEHYYHGAKFKKNNPEFSLLFSLNSGSEISKDPLIAKKAGGKTGIMKKKVVNEHGKKTTENIILRQPDIVMDPDFFGKNGRAREEMKKAWEAKFTQNPELKDLLLKTGDAKLQHFVRGKKPEVWVGLMEVREKLK